MLASFLSLLALAAIVLASYGLGRPLLRTFCPRTEDIFSIAVWSVGLGLVLWGTALMALGLCGVLSRELIGMATTAAAFWGLGELLRSRIQRSARARQDISTRGGEPLEDTSPIAPPRRPMLAMLGMFCTVAIVASLLSALAPPTAGDALCYHLELPKRFLAEGRLVFLPDHENSTFPLLVEMWYLWALALDGGVAAQLVHWALGLELACAAVLLARSIVGRDWAWFAGAIVLLTPGITNQMTAPLNDVGLAALTTLAVAAWWRAAVEDEGPAWFAVAGIFLGGALATKYLAMLFAAAWGATWLVQSLRSRVEKTAVLRGALTMLILAAAIAGPWYARAAWHRGNPVYPFFHTAVSAEAPATIRESKLALGRAPWNLAAGPWAVTMHPERFGGRGHQLGCLYLMLLPGLFLARRLRGVRLLLAISAVYFLGCFLLRQNIRFLYPLLPLCAAPCVWTWIEAAGWPRLARAGLTASAAGMLFLGAVWPAYRARQHWQVAFGVEDRTEYLHRTEPSYAAAMLANMITNRDTRILSQDNRGYYFNASVTQESLYRRRTHYDRAPGDIAAALHQEGFRYLILADAAGPGIAYDPTLSRLVDRSLASGRRAGFRQLTEYDFQDTDGAKRHYRLIRIEPLSTAQAPTTLR